MTDYRDYGYVAGGSASEVAVNSAPRSQVYIATHKSDGSYLPYMNRSFISFSFGGKNIEDFNLLATIENNALQRKLYADFGDNVTDSDVWDGQIYWSTHFNSNSIDFILVTDGMTENQLDDFKHYFIPGKIEELIVSEHPNRAILARVSSVPEFSMLPFEKEVTIKIAGMDYKTSTTLYKGKIELNFTMDEPFWYSRANLLDVVDSMGQAGRWIDANKQSSVILDDKDALKVLQEDGVPFSVMLRNMDIDPDQSQPVILVGTEQSLEVDLSNNSTGSRVGGAEVGEGHVAYVLLNSDAGVTISPSPTYGYFFYAGTAPCRPTLTFSLTPTLNENGFINVPANSYTNTSTPYSTISLQCTEIQEFHFTTPGIFTGYNQVINVFKQDSLVGAAWEEVRTALRDNVKHWAPRQYANYVINQNMGSSTVTTAELLAACCEDMQTFLKNNNDTIAPAIFTINGQTGQAEGAFVFHNSNNIVTSSVENVGDMVRSNYITLKERTVPDANGYIQPWADNISRYSYRVWADCTLENFNMLYKYMYL